MNLSALQDPLVWYERLYRTHPCYSYQLQALQMMEWAMRCALQRHRLPYSVDMLLKWARQSGKNESAARFDTRFLMIYGGAAKRGMFAADEIAAVHAAPGWRPAISMAKRRLKRAVNVFPQCRDKKSLAFEDGYVARLANLPAIIVYLSANPEAQNKGETASAFMRVDEAQLVDTKEYAEALAPQRSTTAAPAFFMGTGGSEHSLIETMEDRIVELEDRFRHAGYPVKLLHKLTWLEAARYNEEYDTFVRGEMERLGPDSTTFITEYMVGRTSAGRMFDEEDLVQMFGDFGFQQKPSGGKIYVAGVDYCGAGETASTDVLDSERVKKRDISCAWIWECAFREWEDPDTGKRTSVPVLKLAAFRLWPGQHDVADEIYEYLFNRWRVVRVHEDANGAGDYPSAQHEFRRPSQVKRLKMTAADNDRMGRRLESAVKCRRLTLCSDDGSREWGEMHKQFKYLEREVFDGGRMRWGHPRNLVVIDGVARPVHDDIPKAAALGIDAAYDWHFLFGKQEVTDPDDDYVPWDEAAGMGEAA